MFEPTFKLPFKSNFKPKFLWFQRGVQTTHSLLFQRREWRGGEGGVEVWFEGGSKPNPPFFGLNEGSLLFQGEKLKTNYSHDPSRRMSGSAWLWLRLAGLDPQNQCHR